MSENIESASYNIPQPEVMYSTCLLFLTNSPKLFNLLLYMTQEGLGFLLRMWLLINFLTPQS